MLIHAYAAMGPKAELQPFEYELGQLDPNEVVLNITHCGICHSDIHLIDNDWQISQYPLVPGHEIVGIVKEVGSTVTHLAPGQRVGVGWQANCCHTCEWCVSGDEVACAQNQPTCVGRHGGFADAIRVDGRFAFPLPDALPSETVGPLLCGGTTVYTPLKRYATPTSHVGVVGIGGLGHLAIQFAHTMGCEVTAFSTSPEKASEAKSLGADHFIVSTDEKQMRTSKASVDLLISAVTADLDWNAWMKTLRPHGILCFVGASPGLVDIPIFSLIGTQTMITGSAIGTRTVIAEMLQFASRHSIAAKAEVVPMSRVNDAIEKVRHNQARYRMVLTAV